MRHGGTWGLTLLACLLTALTNLATGQSFAPPTGNPTTVPASLASPRATMRAFLTGMNDAKIGQAVTALNLGNINPMERAERGPQLAFQLWAILNREVFIRYEDLPAASDAPAYRLPITSPKKQTVGYVVIDKDNDGAYRFTSATLDDLAVLWERVRDKPVLAGLSDPNLQEFDPATWIEEQMPSEGKSTILGVPNWKWLLLAMLILWAALIAWFLRLITLSILRWVLKLKKTDLTYRDIMRGGFGFSLTILSGLVGNTYGYFRLPEFLAAIVGFGSRMGSIIGLVLVAFAIWDLVVQTYARRSSDKSEHAERLVAPILSRLGKAVILLIAFVSVLTVLGVNVTGLVATLGIGGLVLAFAAKDSVENLFGSIMVLVEKPFRIGDWVRIGTIDGEVEEIRLRSSRIRTFEDSVVVVPNSMLVTNSVENFGMRRHRRLRTILELSYDTSQDQLSAFTEQVRQMLLEHPNVWDEKRFVYLNDFGERSLRVLVYCFIIAPTWQDELEYRSEILSRIIQIAEDLKVQFAYAAHVHALEVFGGHKESEQE